MTPNSSTDEPRSEPPDSIDRLLSDYFKAQLKRPWPTAPHVPSAEPSSIGAGRSPVAATLTNRTGVGVDNSRARYTLAASVALLLGTCWYFSSGFQSANRIDPTNPSRGGVLGGAGASKPAPLEEIRKDKAMGGGKALPRPPMELP
jgi:hypothetical protein